MSVREKRRSFLGTFLKVILTIIIIFSTLIIGGYLVLKFGFGIDVIDIKHKINLLNSKVDESAIITNPYSDTDSFDGFTVIFGENNIYVQDGETFKFNIDEFNNAEINNGEILLTSKQFIGCTNEILKNIIVNNDNTSSVTLNTGIKQLEFSNLIVEENITKVDVKTVIKFDFLEIKNEIKKTDNFFTRLVLKYIPDSIYATINAEVLIDETDSSYSYNLKSILLNNLTQKDSNEIVELLSKLYVDEQNSFDSEIINQFMTLMFSNSEGGLLTSLNIENFSFRMVEDEIFIVLNNVM